MRRAKALYVIAFCYVTFFMISQNFHYFGSNFCESRVQFLELMRQRQKLLFEGCKDTYKFLLREDGIISLM